MNAVGKIWPFQKTCVHVRACAYTYSTMLGYVVTLGLFYITGRNLHFKIHMFVAVTNVVVDDIVHLINLNMYHGIRMFHNASGGQGI